MFVVNFQVSTVQRFSDLRREHFRAEWLFHVGVGARIQQILCPFIEFVGTRQDDLHVRICSAEVRDEIAPAEALTGGTFSWRQDVNDVYLDYTVAVVPEPSSLAMLAFGVISLWLFRKRS